MPSPDAAMIATVTLNPAVDAFTEVDRVEAETKLACSQPEYHPGGGGINVARMLHELGGVPSVALWSAGGIPGRLMAQLLDDLGVAHRPVPHKGYTRVNWIVRELETNKEFRFGMPGPRLSARDLGSWTRAVAATRPRPEFLVLSGSLPPGAPANTYVRLARAAGKGCRLVIDAKGPALRAALASRPFLVKPNIGELAALAGRRLKGVQDVRGQARRLVESGRSENVVCSIGAGGAAFAGPEGDGVVRAPKVKVVSKVGAGDSMVAGIVHALARGKALDESVRFGVACGTAACLTRGARIASRAEVQGILRKVRGARQ